MNDSIKSDLKVLSKRNNYHSRSMSPSTLTEEESRKIVSNYVEAHKHEFMLNNDIKILVLTWNVASTSIIDEIKNSLQNILSKPPDLICFGFQEVDMSVSSIMKGASVNRNGFEFDIYNALPDFKNYKLIQSQHFGGVTIMLFALYSFYHQIISITSNYQPLGPMNMANKGAVAISLKTENNSLCFVNSHLPAHQKNISGRNEAYAIIVNKLLLKHEEEEMSILKHDFAFWCGDLNYRVDLDSCPPELAAVSVDRIKSFLEVDQLNSVRRSFTAFGEFREPPITFRPTYKISIQNNELYYCSKRLPAWCDRVLYRSKEKDTIRCNDYTSIEELTSSDHLPVYAVFNLNIMLRDEHAYSEVINKAYANLSQVLTQLQPKIELSSQDLDFGELEYYQQKVLKMKVTNTGKVNTMFVIDKDTSGEQSDSCRWLTHNIGVTALKPGDSIDLSFIAFVDVNVIRTIPPIDTTLETILIFKLTQGRIYFVSFKCMFMRGCFGCPLELLIKFDGPLKSKRIKTLNKPSVSLPRQVLSMTNYIRLNLATATKEVFRDMKVDQDVIEVMNILDHDSEFKLTNVPTDSVANALILFLSSLPVKLVSRSTLKNSSEFWDQPFNNVIPPYSNVLTHIMMFFKDLAKLKCNLKFSEKLFASILDPLIFEQDIDQFIVPKSISKKHSYFKTMHLFNSVIVE